MRIAFVTPEFVTESDFDGGLANYLYRVSLALIKFGHEPIIIVSSDKDETINFNGIEVNRVKCIDKFEVTSKMNIFNLWYHKGKILKKKLNQLNKIKKIDIVQYPNVTGIGYHRIKTIPSVVRISSFQPLFRKYSGFSITKESILYEQMEMLSMKRADGVFGPSFVIAKEIENVINKNIKIIESPFIIEENKLDYSIYNDNLKGKKYLLFFGTISLLKGAVTIGEVINKVLDSYKDLYFVFVGKDSTYNNKSVINMIFENSGKYKNRVLHFGKLKHSELYPIIENSETVVLPSRIDNFPNTCLEAMAYKQVIIGTRDTSFEQLLEENISGFLCNRDDKDDLYNKIHITMNLDDKRKKEIGDKAYNRINSLNPDIVVKQLIDYYDECISNFKK